MGIGDVGGNPDGRYMGWGGTGRGQTRSGRNSGREELGARGVGISGKMGRGKESGRAGGLEWRVEPGVPGRSTPGDLWGLHTAGAGGLEVRQAMGVGALRSAGRWAVRCSDWTVPERGIPRWERPEGVLAGYPGDHRAKVPWSSIGGQVTMHPERCRCMIAGTSVAPLQRQDLRQSTGTLHASSIHRRRSVRRLPGAGHLDDPPKTSRSLGLPTVPSRQPSGDSPLSPTLCPVGLVALVSSMPLVRPESSPGRYPHPGQSTGEWPSRHRSVQTPSTSASPGRGVPVASESESGKGGV